MTSSSLRIIGAPVSWTISDLAAQSQQIPVPATTAGSTLLAFIASNQTSGANHVTGVVDSASNTWAQAGSTQSSGSGSGHIATQIFAAVGSTSSATWFKVTPNANLKQVTVSFVEIAGCTASPIDVNNGGTATSAVLATATNATTTNGDAVFLFGATGGQSLTHPADGTGSLEMVGAPYSAGTAGAGVMASVATFIGSPVATVLTTWSSVSSTNFAWSSISLKASTPGVGGLTQVFPGNAAASADVNQVINLLNGSTTGVPVLVSNRIQAALTGSAALSGYVGGTVSGSPTSGSHFVGDWSVDQSGCLFICTAAGSPGTWQRVGINGYLGRAYQNAPQSITGSSSLQLVTTNTADFDPKSMWTGASNGFTIPFSGARWRVIAGQHISLGASNGRIYTAITRTRAGVTTEISRGYDGPTVSGNGGGVVSDVQAFNSGDIVKAGIMSTASGTTVGTSAANYLVVALADA